MWEVIPFLHEDIENALLHAFVYRFWVALSKRKLIHGKHT